MSQEPRTYSRVESAEKMIEEMVEKRPNILWAVEPCKIAVMGVDNKERTEKAVNKNPVYAKLRIVKGAEKALFLEQGMPVRYIIEIFWSDWNRWNLFTRQAVIFSKLLEITPEEEKRNKPDCVGFNVLIDVLGVNWEKREDLPNLLSDEVEFDLDLRPGLDDADDDADDE